MPKYELAALVTAVTGCRPSELVLGVHLAIQNNLLLAHINGTKVDVERAKGQERRDLFFHLDHVNGMVQSLINKVNEAGGILTISIASATNFSSAMRNAGKREWPKRKKTVTPYSMRHQMAADLKSSGSMSSADISAALGHLSECTKTVYGHSNIGRPDGITPFKVLPSTEIKLKTPSTKAVQRFKRNEGLENSDGSNVCMDSRLSP